MTKQNYIDALVILMSLESIKAELNKLSVKALETMYNGLLRNAIGTSDMAAKNKELQTENFILSKRCKSLEKHCENLKRGKK